jgi:FAD/FMN-containing dehydrogenase
VGPGHSFNRFVCSEGLMLSTSKMNKVRAGQGRP